MRTILLIIRQRRPARQKLPALTLKKTNPNISAPFKTDAPVLKKENPLLEQGVFRYVIMKSLPRIRA